MAITQERLEEVATEVVIHVLDNIGTIMISDYIDDYAGDLVTEDEFEEIYDTVQGIANDTIQRIMDLGR